MTGLLRYNVHYRSHACKMRSSAVLTIAIELSQQYFLSFVCLCVCTHVHVCYVCFCVIVLVSDCHGPCVLVCLCIHICICVFMCDNASV